MQSDPLLAADGQFADTSSRTPTPSAADRAPAIHLNLRVRGLRPSATVAINELSDDMQSTGRRVFKMGLGQSPFPVPAPVVAELQRHASEKAYLPVKGLPALRDAVARHHCRTFSISTRADDVLVGPGSKELMFLLQLAYDGDVVIPSPAWVSYAPQAQIIGRHVRWLHTRAENGWRLTPDDLDAHCRDDASRPRLLILNYPSNPTGGTYEAEELGAIAEVARKYRIIVLSDEIYGKVHHDGSHRSIVPMYPEGTIFSGGLSKWCGAGGWRLGVLVFPTGLRWLLDAIAAVASETFTSTSAPIQFAAARAFEDDPEIERYLEQSRRVLRALGGRLAATLEHAGVRVSAPKGGFYLFPDFEPYREQLRTRGITTSTELCRTLLDDTGVAILPGQDFGRPADELTARIAYVNFDGGRALDAVAQLPGGTDPDDEFLHTYCGETLDAVDTVCRWLGTGG